MAATVRRLDDGSLALVVTGGDAHLLDDAARSGGTLLVTLADPASDRARTELARGLSVLAGGPVGDAYASLLLAGTLAARSPDADPHLALTAILAAADAAWSAGDRPACLTALEAARTALDGADDGREPLYDHLIGLRALLQERPADAVAPCAASSSTVAARTSPRPWVGPRSRRCCSATSRPPAATERPRWPRREPKAAGTAPPRSSNTWPTPSFARAGTPRPAPTRSRACERHCGPSTPTPPLTTARSWPSPPRSKATPRR
ncbi:hypothetical protein GCM10029992_35440 [Glycomyces albus]